MYAGTAEMRIYWPMDGEFRRWFPGDLGGNAPHMCNLMHSASLYECHVCGDLFNAPEPIIEEPILEFDPITAAICMISSDEDVINAEVMKVGDIESIQNEHFFSEVYYDCEKDLLEKSAIKESFLELPDFKSPAFYVEEDHGRETDRSVTSAQSQKSVTSGCLKTTDWGQEWPFKLNLKGLQEMNLEDAYGIRRAYSDGDILCNLNSSLSEYDVGGDLFNAPEPIIEEPMLELDSIAAAIGMISNGEEVITSETMKVAEIDCIQNETLFNEVYYDCKKHLMEKSAIKESSFSDPSDFKLPVAYVEENPSIENDSSVREEQMQKNVSSGCMNSTEWSTQDWSSKTNMDALHEVNLEDAYGIRRAYSEGDIHTLGNCHSSFEQLKLRDLKIEERIEERKEKINRYMRKKTRRNFGRKIKYACRKALADSQPRVRGRFAKSEAMRGCETLIKSGKTISVLLKKI